MRGISILNFNKIQWKFKKLWRSKVCKKIGENTPLPWSRFRHRGSNPLLMHADDFTWFFIYNFSNRLNKPQTKILPPKQEYWPFITLNLVKTSFGITSCHKLCECGCFYSFHRCFGCFLWFECLFFPLHSRSIPRRHSLGHPPPPPPTRHASIQSDRPNPLLAKHSLC